MTPEDDLEPDEDFDDDDLDEDDEDEGFDEGLERTAVTVEVTGLSLYTHHGVTEAEREIGQRLILDLRFDAGACDATVTDRVEDTVDYGARLRGRRARRPAALVQDAGGAVHGDRRPDARRLRGLRGLGEGDEARAADRAARGVRLGRGLAHRRARLT